MEYKVCTKCKKELPATLEYFFKDKYGKYGLHSICKKCGGFEYRKPKPIPRKGYKFCSKCGKELPISPKYFYRRKNRKMGFCSKCKECSLKYMKEYRQTERAKIVENTWRQSEQGKKSHKNAMKKYLSKIENKIKQINACKRWRQTERGRKSDIITQTRRQRNLKWIELFPNPFDENEEIDWHHIDDEHVIAIPKDLHQLYNGYKHHREMCIDVIKQIYKLENDIWKKILENG